MLSGSSLGRRRGRAGRRTGAAARIRAGHPHPRLRAFCKATVCPCVYIYNTSRIVSIFHFHSLLFATLFLLPVRILHNTRSCTGWIGPWHLFRRDLFPFDEYHVFAFIQCNFPQYLLVHSVLVALLYYPSAIFFSAVPELPPSMAMAMHVCVMFLIAQSNTIRYYCTPPTLPCPARSSHLGTSACFGPEADWPVGDMQGTSSKPTRSPQERIPPWGTATRPRGTREGGSRKARVNRHDQPEILRIWTPCMTTGRPITTDLPSRSIHWGKAGQNPRS